LLFSDSLLGDKTILQKGMIFAVDGGITVPNKFGVPQ